MQIYNSFSGCRNHSALHEWWDAHSSVLGLQTQHSCNPNYSGDRDQENCCLRPTWANSLWEPILNMKQGCWKGNENQYYTGGLGGMTQAYQGWGPEFKLQYGGKIPTLRFHFTQSKWQLSKKQTIKNIGKDVGRKQTLTHYWWEYKLVQLLWKSI
jgi:hypothetical protein